MAERDDIRLRQQTKQAATPRVENTARAVKPVNFTGLIGQTQKVLSAQEQARQKAETIYIDDIVTQMRSKYITSQGEIAKAKGLSVFDAIDEQQNILDKQEQSMLGKSQPHIRDKLSGGFAKARLQLERFQTLHASKEEQEHGTDVYKRDLKSRTQVLLMDIGNDDDDGSGKSIFGRSLDEVGEVARLRAKAEGIVDPTQIDLYATSAEGQALLVALESTAATGQDSITKEMFEKYKGKIIDPKLMVKAEKLVAKSEENGIFEKGAQLAGAALAAGSRGNLEGQLAFILGEEGYTSKEKEKATSIARTNDASFRTQKKAEDDRLVEAKILEIRRKREAGESIDKSELLKGISDPGTRNKIEKFIIEEPTVANIDVVRDYEEQISNDPLKFAATFNPAAAGLDLPPAEVKNLTARKKEIQDKNKSFKTSTANKHSGFIENLAGAKGYNKMGSKSSADRFFTFKSQSESLYLQMRDSDKYKGVTDTFEFDQEFKRRSRLINLIEENTAFLSFIGAETLEPVGSVALEERGRRQAESGKSADEIELIEYDNLPEFTRDKLIKAWRKSKKYKPDSHTFPSTEEEDQMARVYSRRKSRLIKKTGGSK
jgi:hypothetical protein